MDCKDLDMHILPSDENIFVFLIAEDVARFKSLRKYVYLYEAETSSGITGTADSHSGSKITCKVRKQE